MKLWLFILLTCLCFTVKSQNYWPDIPFLDNSGVVLRDQGTFVGLISAAAISYGLAEFVFKNDNALNFYQVRSGLFGTTGGTVFVENFGIERRIAPWFGLALELNNQQWVYEEGNGVGIGFNTYYRWHLFAKKKLSPYIEYGAGFFYGFSKFPTDGTNFTFNLTTQLGMEYSFENNNKLRLSYGHLHQSNNDLLDPNPGEDGNGINLTYLWFWK